MSGGNPVLDRDALVTLIDRMIRAEARTEAPPESERGAWLYGGVGPTEYTRPDAHGWMAIIPPTTRVWTPKALVAWHEALRSDFPVDPELLINRSLSLARWPAIERGVRSYLAALSKADPDTVVASAHTQRR